MRTKEITNDADVIDSREVIERIAELESDLENDIATDEEKEELKALKALAEEAEGYAPNWKYGEALIRDSYFTEYAMEMLQDCGELPKEIPHYIVIDEEATARNIRQDYSSVEFGDVTYWIRN